MRWEDERYVRLYTRDTPELASLSWEARALMWELLRKVDRAGLLPVGRSGVRGLAGLLRMPLDVVESALAELVDDGCVAWSSEGVFLPNFLAAQEANQSDRARKAASREKAAATARDVTHCDQPSHGVTIGHELGPNVTRGHEPSHAVTSGHSYPSLAVPSLAVPEPPVVPQGGPTTAAPLELFPDEPKPQSPVDVVWTAYDRAAKASGHRPYERSPKRERAAQARIDEIGVERVVAAVRGCWLDPWAKPGGTCGKSTGRCEPEHVLRNIENTEKYARLWESLEKSKPVAATHTDRARGQAALDAIVAAKRARLQDVQTPPEDASPSDPPPTPPCPLSVAAIGTPESDSRVAS